MEVLYQIWLKYWDSNGEGWASPDIVVPELRLVVECKRTYTPAADAQLLLVYKPLLDRLWPADWRMVAASQFWQGPEKPLIHSLQDAGVGMNYWIGR